jgi:hypothetical protein
MGQSEFSSPSIIKSCATWKKARKNLVKHWTLKQMNKTIFSATQ